MSVTHMSRRDTPVSHAHVTALSRPWRHMKSRSRSRSLYWVTFSYYQPTLGPRREEGICDDDGERLVPVP